MNIYAEYKSRREKLYSQIGDGVAILVNAKEATRNRDCFYPFRSDSYFHYLSAFPEPESIIVIFGERSKSIIFSQLRMKLKKFGMVIFTDHQKRVKNFYFMKVIPCQKFIKFFLKC